MQMHQLDAAVGALAAVEPSRLSVDQLQQLVAAARAQADRLLGVAGRALGELQARTGGRLVDPRDGSTGSVLGWLRDTTCSSGTAAGSAVRTSLALRDLPLVADAVVRGQLTADQAHQLARLHGRVDLAVLQASQAELVSVAAARDPQSIALYVRHLVATHCEPALEADDKAAWDARYLQLTDQGDGVVRGRFRLSAEDAEVVRTVLEPLARPSGLTDQRSAGQRRADALVEVFDLAVRHADLPAAGGQRPQVSYVVPAGWAAGAAVGVSQESLLRSPDAFCASAAWSGPQTRSRVESVLCDARLTRVLLDPAGQVVGLQSLTGEITAAQRRALAARDRHCVVRGCSRPPAFCDAHHLLSRSDAGPTDLANLVLLCRRHHVLWHRGRTRRDDLHLPWASRPDSAPATDDPARSP